MATRSPTAEEIASWPAPNFVNPETRRPLVLGVEIPLCALVIIFTAMRFYSRTVIIRALGSDDWIMLCAAIPAVGCSIMTCISTLPAYQTGYHLWDLRPDIAANPVKTAQMAMATQLLFVFITAFTKVSILLTYLRIFPSKTNKIFCKVLLGFTGVWALASFFLYLFQCSPVQSYWYIAAYPNRKCVHIGPIYYITGCLNVFSDLLIFLWPAKDLWTIRISQKQRITLIAMFSLGVVVCVAGACRIWYTAVYINTYDALYQGATLYAIVAIETSIGIVCGCLPACKPLMSKIAPHIFTSTHSDTYQSTKKKGTKVAGQSFPFQSLNGGITKVDGFSVEYHDVGDRQHGRPATPRSHSEVSVDKGRVDGDAVSAESQEWIVLQDHPENDRVKTVTMEV